VTVSSSRHRRKESGEKFRDESGDVAQSSIQRASHKVAKRKLVSDDLAKIQTEVKEFLAGGSDVMVLTGGTGISPTDVTIEAVKPFLEKELVGFGEAFRSMSYKKVGNAAILTRATAGVSGGKLIVCLPGSPDGVRTALRAFLPEFAHIVSVSRGG
jgi:molybdenum cofactor biosynthesis protein B